MSGNFSRNIDGREAAGSVSHTDNVSSVKEGSAPSYFARKHAGCAWKPSSTGNRSPSCPFLAENVAVNTTIKDKSRLASHQLCAEEPLPSVHILGAMTTIIFYVLFYLPKATLKVVEVNIKKVPSCTSLVRQDTLTSTISRRTSSSSLERCPPWIV